MKLHKFYSLARCFGTCVCLWGMAISLASAEIKHSFLAAGTETRIIDEDGKVSWQYPRGSRDGWVLANGHILLALSGNGGEVVEVTRDQQVVLRFKGTQKEVDAVQRLKNGNTLLSESGEHPRLLEIDSTGKVVREIPLIAQKKDTHLQQRMTRQLPNGNFLVPHLLDRVIKEYQPDGKVVWEAATPNMPFTAIRLKNGNTLAGCTLGDLVIELDRQGKIVWQVDNNDLPGRPINDACGVQRLPNGNTVITSHHAKGNEVKLTEITRDKKIVWTFTDGKPFGIHHFQILTTNGKKVKGPPLK